MGRPNRDFTTDNRFHLINHGVDGQDLFAVEDDWLLFESLFQRVCDDCSVRLNAYALMSTHYHLLVDLSDCEDRAGVSGGIGVLQSTYAQYFNDRTDRRGPLFEPRFFSFGVDGDTKTHRAVRYIHRNPIDICGPRALGAYRWSSLPVYLGRRPSPSWLDCGPLRPQDPIAHLADLAGCHADDLYPFDVLPPQRRTSLGRIEEVVDIVGATADGRERDEIIFLLALDLRAADVVVIAEQRGCSTSKVRKSAHRARTKRIDDARFARLLDRVLVELTKPE